MKILTKFALAAMMLITTLTAQAGGVRGYYRSSRTYVAPYYRSDSGSVGHSYGSSAGYVYRNPYAASPLGQRARVTDRTSFGRFTPRTRRAFKTARPRPLPPMCRSIHRCA